MTDELRERAKKLHKRHEELLNMPLTCPKCHGKGTYEVYDYTDSGEINEKITFPCEVCNGTGKITLEFYEELQKAVREK